MRVRIIVAAALGAALLGGCVAPYDGDWRGSSGWQNNNWQRSGWNGNNWWDQDGRRRADWNDDDDDDDDDDDNWWDNNRRGRGDDDDVRCRDIPGDGTNRPVCWRVGS